MVIENSQSELSRCENVHGNNFKEYKLILCQLSRIIAGSLLNTTLISCSPVQVTKIISWINFMCLSLKFSPFFFSKFEFFLFFVQFQIFAHIWSLTKIISSLRWWKQILTVCTSCKTSYLDWSQFPCHNLPVVVVVVVHWHSWKRGGGGGGG